MLDNLITFQKYDNVCFNFNDNLRIKDSLSFLNCSNFNIKIDCKINKITIKNCYNFRLVYFDTISGIDIEKSNDIVISRIYNEDKNQNLNFINCFQSNVNFEFDNLVQLLDIKIINENSSISFRNNSNY